ncbi:hypothetical protein Tco_1146911 [Tanacetum coccineum]
MVSTQYSSNDLQVLLTISTPQYCALNFYTNEGKVRTSEFRKAQAANDRILEDSLLLSMIGRKDNTIAITTYNPTLSSDVVIKSTSTFPNLFLEETNTFDNSIPESETFCFNLEEISSGSPTTRSDLSLPDYKAFYVDNDHFKERSSGEIPHISC